MVSKHRENLGGWEGKTKQVNMPSSCGTERNVTGTNVDRMNPKLSAFLLPEV